MSWWKPKPTPEEVALTDAAMRVRMQLQSLRSASPNEIDRAWARIIADTLEMSGWRLQRIARGAFGTPLEHVGHGVGNIANDCPKCAIEHPDEVAALNRYAAAGRAIIYFAN